MYVCVSVCVYVYVYINNFTKSLAMFLYLGGLEGKLKKEAHNVIIASVYICYNFVLKHCELLSFELMWRKLA